MSFSGQEQRNEKAAQEKILRDATNRIAFVQGVSHPRYFGDKDVVQTAKIKEYREIAGYAARC